jgi:pyruvate carboxylase
MGLEHRWPEVSRAYAQVNRLFGDIVKVTPTSKVVGDMALSMVANDLTPADVVDPAREVAFPESVVSLFRGELGFPPDGFPQALSRKVLKAEPPAPYRPGDTLPEVDLEAQRREAERVCGHQIDDQQLASWLMYPKVYRDYSEHRRRFGDVSALPTGAFFYGMAEREEIGVGLDPGKTLVIRMQGTAPAEEDGVVKVFFELNGQPRTMRIEKAGAVRRDQRAQAEAGNAAHVPAPMPGMIVTISVKSGQAVRAGDPLLSIEAMKMETQIRAERDGTVRTVHVRVGETVAARDLLVEYA